MNAASDEDDRFALPDQFGCFAIARGWRSEFAWIGELVLDLSEVFETREIRGRADCGHDERLAHRCPAKRLKRHTVTGLIEFLKIFDYLVPRREFAILARRKSEYVRGGGNFGLSRGDNR